MSALSEPPVQRQDTDELAKFGYKQELDRSLGSFSSFAAGFSYISILTGHEVSARAVCSSGSPSCSSARRRTRASRTRRAAPRTPWASPSAS